MTHPKNTGFGKDLVDNDSDWVKYSICNINSFKLLIGAGFSQETLVKPVKGTPQKPLIGTLVPGLPD